MKIKPSWDIDSIELKPAVNLLIVDERFSVGRQVIIDSWQVQNTVVVGESVKITSVPPFLINPLIS